jgi:hypothetical protein
VTAVVLPARPVAVAVAASFLGFGIFVAAARLGGGALATCGCFGKPDTPPTFLHAALDAVLAAAAAAVAAAGPSGLTPHVLSHQYLHGVPLAVVSALCAWLAFLVMSTLARVQGQAAQVRGPRPVS